MIIAGFRGSTPEECSQIADDIKKHNLGGVILFDRDMQIPDNQRNIKSPQQLKTLCNWLQNLRSEPLFIAIDQEGGRVSRLNPDCSFPPTLSAKASTSSDASFNNNCQTICQTLKDAGINLNLAPVVDTGVNQNNFIFKKERIYSTKPDKVATYAGKAIKINHDNNILTAIKHFPGHGSSQVDSHLGMTDVTTTWNERELIPFKKLGPETDMVMTAHIFHRFFDKKYPATLSHKIITGILREKLGYDGVIISDDMGMKAISANYGLEESITHAINAGVDILLLANNSEWDLQIVEKAVAIIVNQVKAGRIKEERIDEAVERIDTLKAKLKARN